MLSQHIKRNTYYTIVFSSADAESVHNACMHLQLDPRCKRLLGSLLPGHAIFRQSQASWTNAMLVKIDYIAPDRNLTAVKYQPHEYIPSIALDDAPNVLKQLNADIEEIKNAQKRQDETKSSDLEQFAMKLLQLRVENQFAPVARLFEALGNIRFDAQVAIREMLEGKGLADFKEERIARSNMLLMDVTADGFKALGLSAPDENKGRGSISHRHFAHWIKIHFENKGRKAYVEWVIPGTNHAADVAVQRDNRWEVFEVCVTSFDNVLSHIRACFENNNNAVASLTIVTATKTKLKELKKSIQSDFIFTLHADKIQFDVISNYIIKGLK